MKQIPLTKIGFFNPGRLSDEEIEQFFITRIPFFEYLFEKIVSERPKSIPQHYLVIGQRGMGKTSLLMRIAAELRKSPHNKKFIALSFPEEQYNVDRLSKFWLNCLDALADALDKENNKTDLDLLDAEIAAITKQQNVEAKTIYELFCKWTTKIKRRPVLLVDNLNLIFAKITVEEQHQLRGTLISNDAPILVGASASTIEETVDYGAPFYDAFQISYLKKLSFEESLEVLLNLAKITGNENFENNIYKQRGRLEALYSLTGGTPRTLAILFPLIQDGFSESIQTDLDALLDAITPLYKARFEELAPQLQVIMDAVALHWDPINLDQLRTATQLPNSILSPQLKRLTEVGWLQKLDAYKAKGGAYELSERFFNVWYLMRRSSRRQKRELYCLTKFLESFYGKDLHDIAKNRIKCKSENINHIALDLALADAVKDRFISEQLRNKSYDALFTLSENDGTVLKDFAIPKEVSDKKIIELVEKINSCFKKKDYINCEILLKKLLLIDPKNLSALRFLASIYQSELGKYDDAEKYYILANEVNDKDSATWFQLGYLYSTDLKKYEKAEGALIKASKLSPQDFDTWSELAKVYLAQLNMPKKAKSAFKKALEIDNESVRNWQGLGIVESLLNNFKDAEVAFKKAIEIDSKNSFSWLLLGKHYMSNMQMYLEAEKAFKKSIELDDKSEAAYFYLGVVNHLYLDKYKEAEMNYKASINNGGKTNVYNYLGTLYHDNLKNFSEAEFAYKKSIEFDEDDISAKYNLVFLLRDKLNKLEEARVLFSTIKISKEYTDSHYLNEALFALHDKNIGIAESSLKKALQVIGENLPTNTEDDWFRSAAAIIKLVYGASLLNVLVSNGYDIILRPFYVAIQFLTNKEEPLFFNSIAAEVREPAKKIVEILKNHMD